MSVEQQAPPPASSADRSPADPLAAYVARMRHQRRRYAIVLAIVAVAALVLTEVVLRTGEIAHAKLHSAKAAAPAPTATAAASTVHLAWHNSDATATGDPVYEGTVITYSAHTVTGRNYATGAAVWTYTRTDLSVCTVIQEQGTTIAFFNLDGNCDEVDAFTSDTGQRTWYRTLDSNGTAINGRPNYQASQHTILMTTSQVVWAIDPGGGLDWWMYVEPSGCTTVSAALGTQGTLISQHCADGYHLLLRDPYLGNDDTGKTKTIKWTLKGVNVIPVSADALVSAFDLQTSQLVQYNQANGTTVGSHTLTPAPDIHAPITTSSQTGTQLITVGTESYWITANDSTATPVWSTALIGPPSLIGPDPLGITAQGIVDLDSHTGNTKATYAIPAAAAGSSAYSVGSGFVVAGSSTSVYL